MYASTPQQRWLSLAQAARYAGYTTRTLRSWELAGMVKFHRIVAPGAVRGTVRLDRLELDRLIEEACAPASVLAMNSNREGA